MEKTTYLIYEKQHVNSYCEPSYEKEFESLDEAKRFAVETQLFQGTALVIEYENGFEICYREGGKWKYFNNNEGGR